MSCWRRSAGCRRPLHKLELRRLARWRVQAVLVKMSAGARDLIRDDASGADCKVAAHGTWMLTLAPVSLPQTQNDCPFRKNNYPRGKILWPRNWSLQRRHREALQQTAAQHVDRNTLADALGKMLKRRIALS